MRHAAFTYLNENYSHRKSDNAYFPKMMDRKWEKEDKEESSHKISDETREMYLNGSRKSKDMAKSRENRNNPKKLTKSL